jgi:hypothetical protein
MLQCPAGTVMSRLARARSELGDLLLPTVVGLSGTKDGNAKETQRQAEQPR